MSERQNTNNTLPSNTLADLNDNTLVIDEWTNSNNDFTQDRFGKKIKTRYKIESELQKIIDDTHNSSYLPNVGGTLTGDLTINKTFAGISFKTKAISPYKIATDETGESFIFYLPDSANVVGTKLKYTRLTTTWNFENSKVTINGTPLLKQGDYGLGGLAPLLPAGTNFDWDIVTSSNQILTLSGKYVGTPDDTKTWGGVLQVFRRAYNASGGCTQTIRYEDKIYERTGNFVSPSWVWGAWKQYLKAGDAGLGGFAPDLPATTEYLPNSGFFMLRPRSTSPEPTVNLTGISVMGSAKYGWDLLSNELGRLHLRGIANGKVAKQSELITTANSTVDSNGFYKKASPIIRLFSNDDMEPVDGFEKSGCGLINSEAKGVTAVKIDVGHYEIHGSLGFAKEGWYITLPEDANGNKKLFAKYSTDENNVITIKTYTKKFDFEKCEIVAGEPQDITGGRWIDIRLETPSVELS